MITNRAGSGLGLTFRSRIGRWEGWMFICA